MIHPLLRLIVTRPHLLGEHVEAYAALVGDEVSKASTLWMWRIVFYVGAALFAVLGIVLVGVALLFVAAVPTSDMPLPWLLIVVPVVPLLLAGFCGWRAVAPIDHNVLQKVKTQLSADMAMLREVGSA